MDEAAENERLQRVAARMRAVFFAEYGDIDGMSRRELEDMMRAMMAYHAGELVDSVARFKGEDISVFDAVMEVVRVFIDSNKAQVMEIAGVRDDRAYLLGGPWAPAGDPDTVN